MPTVAATGTTDAELEELEARELRYCAYHEASHREIIELLGGAGHASVWRNSSGKPDEKAWRGHCRISISPGTWKMMEAAIAVLGEDTLPGNWKALVGVAGYVGGRLLAGEDESDISNGLLNGADEDELSASDLGLIGDDLSFDDMRIVIALLKARWREVELEAEALMADAGSALPLTV